MFFISVFFAPPINAKLYAQMKFIMSFAKAPSTNKTQMSQIKAWTRYCNKAQIPCMLVGGWHLSAFATTLIMEGRVKSADSLANYISAVRTYHKEFGFDCPTPSQFGPLDRVIKGLRRMAIRPIKRTLPITPVMLINFLKTKLPTPFCPTDANTLITYKILALLYFLTMLRASSFMPTAYNDVDLVRLVCWGNVSRLEHHGVSGILIKLQKTKTIQNREREQKVPLARNDACPLLCPVRAVETLRSIVGDANISADTPLFQTRDYLGNLRPIIRRKFDSWFNFRLREMGYDNNLYTLHAFRHGGIQNCLMSEQNLALCKLTSDHTSDVILEYSHVPADRRLIISQKMNQNLNTYYDKSIQPDNPLPHGVLHHF